MTFHPFDLDIVEYIYQQNKGLGGAINTGLKHIKGEYFCWADSDDYYEPNAFEIRAQYVVNHPDCAALICDAYYWNEQNMTQYESLASDHCPFSKEPNQFELMLFCKSIFCSGCHMLKTQAFREVNPEMDIYEARRGQNWQLLLPMYYFYDRHILPDVVYNYIVYDDSMSHSDTDYEKKRQRIEDNRRIEIETLKRIEMPKAERDGYIRHVNFFHDKLMMYNARSYADRDTYAALYKKLKNRHALNYKDRLRRIRFLLLGK